VVREGEGICTRVAKRRDAQDNVRRGLSSLKCYSAGIPSTRLRLPAD
jgi:hypothetical protein